MNTVNPHHLFLLPNCKFEGFWATVKASSVMYLRYSWTVSELCYKNYIYYVKTEILFHELDPVLRLWETLPLPTPSHMTVFTDPNFWRLWVVERGVPKRTWTQVLLHTTYQPNALPLVQTRSHLQVMLKWRDWIFFSLCFQCSALTMT